MALGFKRHKTFAAGFEPFTQTFTYNGAVQSLVIPSTGLYQLEVKGSAGGTAYGDRTGYGGNGGYASGYAKLRKGSTIYIVCGGRPYNGGGAATSNVAEGGGATHIATSNRGLLENYSAHQDELLIVAGGGGSGSSYGNAGLRGGHGGGLTGESVSRYNTTWGGGTQTAGGHKSGDEWGGDGSFGKGYDYAAGGGFYGGAGGRAAGGAGGSSYIGNVPEITYKGVTYSPSTSSGNNNSTGIATITRIA